MRSSLFSTQVCKPNFSLKKLYNFVVFFFFFFLLLFCWPFSCICSFGKLRFQQNVWSFWTEGLHGREGQVFIWFWEECPVSLLHLPTVGQLILSYLFRHKRLFPSLSADEKHFLVWTVMTSQVQVQNTCTKFLGVGFGWFKESVGYLGVQVTLGYVVWNVETIIYYKYRQSYECECN